MKTWLIFDVNNVAWQAFHAVGDMSFEGMATGALYGVFRKLLHLQTRYSTKRVAFCFDVGRSVRHSWCITYKANRAKLAEKQTDDEKAARQVLYDQLNLLRNEYLPYLGFRNVFGIDTYEADDLIANICLKQIKKPDRAVIVSSDKDLYQCLRDHISIDRNDANYTKRFFMAAWKIHPRKWGLAKAIAGCSTDNIPGVPGVGEKTAVKFIRGILPKHHKTYKTIKDSEAIISHNACLVELPYLVLRDTDKFENKLHLRKDDLNLKKWRKLMRKLGMESLIDSLPRGL